MYDHIPHPKSRTLNQNKHSISFVNQEHCPFGQRTDVCYSRGSQSRSKPRLYVWTVESVRLSMVITVSVKLEITPKQILNVLTEY